MLGPFATASRRTPIHQMSLLSHERIDVHDNDDDNAWQRGPLWPHRMGPMTINADSILHTTVSSNAFLLLRLWRRDERADNEIDDSYQQDHKQNQLCLQHAHAELTAYSSTCINTVCQYLLDI